MIDYAARARQADTFPKMLRLNAKEHGQEIGHRRPDLGDRAHVCDDAEVVEALRVGDRPHPLDRPEGAGPVRATILASAGFEDEAAGIERILPLAAGRGILHGAKIGNGSRHNLVEIPNYD